MASTSRNGPGGVGGHSELDDAVYTLLQSRRGFLDRYYDSALTIPPEITPGQLGSAEVERIARTLSVVRIAGTIPRRLGGLASDHELAVDRKRTKRVAHALNQSLNAWRPSNHHFTFNEEVLRREGAQLEWSSFAADHRTDVQSSLRVVATWAIRNNELRWGRSSVVNLMNEMAWIVYALRD
jgi:hypothetical protein